MGPNLTAAVGARLLNVAKAQGSDSLTIASEVSAVTSGGMEFLAHSLGPASIFKALRLNSSASSLFQPQLSSIE